MISPSSATILINTSQALASSGVASPKWYIVSGLGSLSSVSGSAATYDAPGASTVAIVRAAEEYWTGFYDAAGSSTAQNEASGVNGGRCLAQATLGTNGEFQKWTLPTGFTANGTNALALFENASSSTWRLCGNGDFKYNGVSETTGLAISDGDEIEMRCELVSGNNKIRVYKNGSLLYTSTNNRIFAVRPMLYFGATVTWPAPEVSAGATGWIYADAVITVTSASDVTQSGTFRIQNSIAATQQGSSRVQKTVTVTQTGVASLLTTTTSSANQSGSARIQSQATNGQSGLSRLQNQATGQQLGVSRLQTRTTVNQSGVSSLIVTVTSQQTNTGLSRVQKTITENAAGLSRIQKQSTANQAGVAALAINTEVLQPIDGLARIIAPPEYSRQAAPSLPSTNANLATAYSTPDYLAALADDGSRVGVTGTGYVIHQFKISGPADTFVIEAQWNGQAAFSPAISPVVMQVWNYFTLTWETIASNNAAAAGTDFTLIGTVLNNTEDYYSPTLQVSFRVYQYGGTI